MHNAYWKKGSLHLLSFFVFVGVEPLANMNLLYNNRRMPRTFFVFFSAKIPPLTLTPGY